MSDFENFKALSQKLGSPHAGLRYIHVAGTNGKGSTCAFLHSILMESGYRRVGLFTSPHLVRENERIRVNHDDIPDADFQRLERRVRDAWSESFTGELAYFAKFTAMAFLWFRECECDFVVLEVGLGGRLDATNIIESPECAVITRIGLDHTELLGDTEDQIAIEKSMIIKPGCPVVVGANQPTLPVFKSRSSAVGAPLYEVADIAPDERVTLGLLGAYQLENAALARKAAQLVGAAPEAILRGLENARWHGRFERFNVRGVTVILDGGHNPNGADALVRSLESEFPRKRVTFIFNARADKDRAGMLEPARRIAERIVHVRDSAALTLDAVLADAAPGSVICVFGTLYQVGEVRKYILEVNQNEPA
ncbi:MAG: bifunctional folylpolyglutamate synthase/dihydrofolate synthase [Oscillospiraceae bacterium]|jgi:dihydrofolate synthase/folylpolyglutamate synthase|nr:bifunctional folylpolyglutamate synthase/dihydrofolate synthase [Oscillospiraceae bacterium]